MSKVKTAIKMRVNPEQSQKVQEICFANDVAWVSGKTIKHLNAPYIYINLFDKLGYSDSEPYFDFDDREEVSAELFIRTNGTCVEELQPKTLSEYLKENKAYESFVENCVKAFLKDLAWYKVFKSENKIISLGNIFIFEDTKEGYTYWYNLKSNIPKPVECAMNEIIFTEVDRRNNMTVLADKVKEYSDLVFTTIIVKEA